MNNKVNIKKKGAKMGIKAVVFDVGGVLALHKNNSLSVHTSIAKKLHISVDQWFDAIDVTYTKSIYGRISEKKLLDIFSKNLNVGKEKIKKIVVDEYKKEFTQNKELYNFAFNLKKKGYKIAILSDQWHLSKRAVILPKYMKKFDVVILSCDIGMRKPSLKIFRYAIKKLRLKAHEIVFIDNQKWNIAPAKKLRMKTILYKNNKQLFKALSAWGIR